MAKFKKPVKKKKVVRKKNSILELAEKADTDNKQDLGSRAAAAQKNKEIKAIEVEEKKLEAYEKAILKAEKKIKRIFIR